MESLAKIMEQHPMRLREQSPEGLELLKSEISIYQGDLTVQGIAKGTVRIKKAFPTLSKDFYEVLAERFKANGFSDERLNDAISHVINNCVYPCPAIAEFITFDRKVKVFTHHQIVRKVEDGENMENYKSFKFKDMPVRVWIHLNDVKQYNIKEQ